MCLFRASKSEVILNNGFCQINSFCSVLVEVNGSSDQNSALCLAAGGTLRIYADSLKPNIPYKTILLSTRDTADFAVVEALEKYGLEKENPREFCIARVTLLL